MIYSKLYLSIWKYTNWMLHQWHISNYLFCKNNFFHPEKKCSIQKLICSCWSSFHSLERCWSNWKVKLKTVRGKHGILHNSSTNRNRDRQFNFHLATGSSYLQMDVMSTIGLGRSIRITNWYWFLHGSRVLRQCHDVDFVHCQAGIHGWAPAACLLLIVIDLMWSKQMNLFSLCKRWINARAVRYSPLKCRGGVLFIKLCTIREKE